MIHRYERFNTTTDVQPVARLLHHAFAGPLEGCERWMATAGHENLRVMRTNAGEVDACLLRIGMGQYYGGRSVPMSGIAGVAVGPESRGRGLAKRLMQECVREIESQGIAISTLYASTQSLYRGIGYEQAGHRFMTTIPWSQVQIESRSDDHVKVRAVREDDTASVRACYTRFASSFDGNLDRGSYLWGRVVQLRDDMFKGFVIDSLDGSGGIDGYLYLHQRRDAPNGRQTIAISDIAFVNEKAGRGLIRFLADFCTMGETFEFFGGPLHPLLSFFQQQRFDAEKRDYWMLRITNIKNALEQRGYSPAVRTTVHLEVNDSLVPANSGTWKLDISEGRAEVSRTGGREGAIRCDIRALASLYSGFYTPQQAKLLGWVEGDDRSLAALRAVFAGGTPWMTDMF